MLGLSLPLGLIIWLNQKTYACYILVPWCCLRPRSKMMIYSNNILCCLGFVHTVKRNIMNNQNNALCCLCVVPYPRRKMIMNPNVILCSPGVVPTLSIIAWKNQIKHTFALVIPTPGRKMVTLYRLGVIPNPLRIMLIIPQP